MATRNPINWKLLWFSRHPMARLHNSWLIACPKSIDPIDSDLLGFAVPRIADGQVQIVYQAVGFTKPEGS